MSRFFAKKTICIHGHKHDSRKEADRCAVLHDKFRKGEITALVYQPEYLFEIDGRPVKMANGHHMKFTLDFAYLEGNKLVYEDVKAKNGYMSRDVPVKIALLRHLRPDIELRIVK